MTRANSTLAPDGVAAPEDVVARDRVDEAGQPDIVARSRAEEKSDSDAKLGDASKPSKQRLRIPGWTLAVGGALIAMAAYIYVPGLYIVQTDDASLQADTVSSCRRSQPMSRSFM
jgi:hypothetical protein